jgi:AraC-like DNA-binding protein
MRAVPDGADADITVATQLRQLRNLQALAAPGWGLDLGAALDGPTHGPAGAVIFTAATLGAALGAMARYATVRTPFIDFRVPATAGHHVMEVIETCDLGSVRTPLLELVLLSIQHTVESALGRPMEGATFRMPAPRPAHWRRYAEVFHAPVEFAGTTAHVSLPRDWLALPCPLADAAAQRSAAARMEALRVQLADDFPDAHVERLLEGDGDAAATLAVMAKRLGVSPRTLVRRLGRRHTSYRALLDRHRRRRAGALLRESRLTVAEIAARLGYEAPTNFARACRRWFGKSPRGVRAATSHPLV